ncbi:acetolactate synthase catalytic subunit [Neorhizobium sp. AL 9.2.2]|uniref:acetolactate synthase catalytic subunit n=1 Tax=Neorhizobium sp. AL 9.2.2 TaxID=2712894 RepID=UPI00353054F3|nr:acetolactate synthase catalytic subunit [Neorhizobium sp. AL 9.2.2]
MNVMSKPATPTTTDNMTGAHVLAAALSRHGVKEIFGQSIPSALFLAAPDYGIRQIGYRTENAGAAMADAFARVSGKVSVVTAQNGPAATLLVPGLAEALKASIPIVAIVQDVSRRFTDKNAFQELDHFALFGGVAKWVRRVADPARIDDYVDMAFAVAATGRPGPVVLLVPLDVLDERPDIDPEAPRRDARLGTFPLDRTVADPTRIAEAARLIAKAKRPLVIAGGGVHSSQAAAEVEALQSLGLPVATTVMGKGAVDETNPLSLGVVGYFMAPRGRSSHLRELVTEADVVLLIGNRTNQNGTDSWSLYPKDATFIHLDIDGGEIGRNYEAMRLAGDAKLTVAALTQALRGEDLSAITDRRKALEDKIAAGRAAHQNDMKKLVDLDASPVRPERLMADLDSVLTPDSIVVADASYSSIWVANFLTARRAGQRFITPRGIAGLGWGLPYALGAKTARPDAPVVCLTGDGGFGHVWSEMETARRMKLPVVVIVLNNQILGYQKHAELSLFGNFTDVCDFEAVDHAAIARAVGCRGVRVEKPEEFLGVLVEALAADTLTVIDVVTDERAHPPITSFQGKEALDY